MIWPIETGKSIELAQNRSRQDIVDMGLRLFDYLASTNTPFGEALRLTDDEPEAFGCKEQLWTVVSLARCIKARNAQQHI